MLNVAEAAKRLGMDRETIRRWIRSGRLRAQRVGRSYAIDARDLRTIEDEMFPMAELPEEWKLGDDGSPAPNWVAALHRADRQVETVAVERIRNDATECTRDGEEALRNSASTHARLPMTPTRFDDYVREVEEKAKAEGPEAVVQWDAFNAHFTMARKRRWRREAFLRLSKEICGELAAKGVGESEIMDDFAAFRNRP